MLNTISIFIMNILTDIVNRFLMNIQLLIYNIFIGGF